MKSDSLEYWRNYFQTVNCDIFDKIKHAITVAVSDCPNEFRLRRDEIAELLFSREDGGCKSGFDGEATKLEAGSSKESKANSGRDGHEGMNKNQVSNFSSGQADEVLRIKEILHNSKDETDAVLFESLRRLQPLALTVDLLKETEIGKAVNPLKKHVSKEICQLARTLIDGWKAMVDEWIKSTEPINIDSSPSRQTNSNLPQKNNTGPKMQKKYVMLRRKPLISQQVCQKFKCLDDVSIQAKLEATKRKLHDSYQQAANAKKQRTIRVIELDDLPKPKQGNIGPRDPHSKLLGRRR
ncbi:hypothetical protein QN277_001936 [Acacia crassicarpa]|uniref:TFIIS N-terminal domain-containing protein n=1 Tax=Acacia crassicarpa TaxID=499986 RepID=A0AAE1N9D0_9FABA|nr:hypothetical protein QN277_001936 [Acacia crassicarpa]